MGDSEMKLIVGLGNPGRQYAGTRHNVGFEVIALLAERLGIAMDQAKNKGLFGTCIHKGEKVLLLMPLTYMNLSWESIRAAMDFYKLDTEDLVVIYDDL